MNCSLCLSECEQQRDATSDRSRGSVSNSVTISGSFVPKCTANGDFEQIQCDDTTKICWCVNEDGFELPSTRTQSGFSTLPNCTNGNIYCFFSVVIDIKNLCSFSFCRNIFMTIFHFLHQVHSSIKHSPSRCYLTKPFHL